MIDLEKYLDSEGRIKIWPKKRDVRLEILKYLGDKFDKGMNYTEKQVNEIINNYHTFNDYFLLRRELVESKLLMRTRDCSKYWKE